MPLVTILYTVKTSFVKEKVQRDLLWYDAIKKEMKVFSGGDLEFRYVKDDFLESLGEEEKRKNNIKSSYRQIPVVKDLEVINYNKTESVSNRDCIEKWFANYLNYNNSNIVASREIQDGVEFDVPEEEISEFLYQIERNGFEYTL